MPVCGCRGGGDHKREHPVRDTGRCEEGRFKEINQLVKSTKGETKATLEALCKSRHNYIVLLFCVLYSVTPSFSSFLPFMLEVTS